MMQKRRCDITRYIILTKSKEILKWQAEKKQKVQANMEKNSKKSIKNFWMERLY